MIKPGYAPLSADQWAPFTATLRLKGVDLTGAALVGQVRLYKNADGSPLVDLAQVMSAAAQGLRIIYAGTASIGDHIASGRLTEVPKGKAETDDLALTLIGIRINESTMESLPMRPVKDTEFEWDMHITPSGQLKGKWFYGPFTVRAGVTR